MTLAPPETRWVLEGYLRVTAGTDQIELGPGDRLDLPAGMSHTTEVMGLAQAIYVSGMPRPTA
jgi:ethanolamine utilization protein EutQ (cupin superfamily)